MDEFKVIFYLMLFYSFLSWQFASLFKLITSDGIVAYSLGVMCSMTVFRYYYDGYYWRLND